MASSSQSARVSHSDTNDAFNPRPAYYTQNSNIRPRNRRLISTAEQELTETSSVGNGSGTSEPNTRSSSPIPAKYPSRTSTREGRSNARSSTRYGYDARDKNSAKTTAGFGKGLFEGGWTGSWSALQELAREVLGNGNEEGEFPSQNGAQTRSASAGGILGGSRKGKGPESWGPEGGLPRRGDDSIGAGSLATREAELRTRKMKSVLESWEGVNGGLDIQGRHKRRTSTDDGPRETEEESDAMVYVHHVQPSDTLTGVVLKYHCDPAIFRKANRFWPNDSIQVKKVVLLPCDACSIKGRPCEAPSKKLSHQNIDLLAPTPEFEDLITSRPSSNGRLDPTEEDDSMEGSSEPIPTKTEEQPWTHVRWVMLFPSSDQPTEIARLPRKTLGYFPPPRRKSITTGSSVSTPRESIDLPFSASLSSTDRDASSPYGTPSRRPSSLSPSNGSYFPPPNSTINPPPARREVMSTAPYRRESIGADSTRLAWMRGPGGVGSLSGRKIGSGNDGLNKWAHTYFPGIAIDDLPSTSIVGAEKANFGFDGNAESSLFSGAGAGAGGIGSLRGSGTSTPVQGVGGIGLEHAAAAIEGWVRRLAVKNPGGSGTPRTGGGGSVNGRSGVQANGDLIELLDGTGSDDGRGFEPSVKSGVGSGRSEDLAPSSYFGKRGGKSD